MAMSQNGRVFALSSRFFTPDLLPVIILDPWPMESTRKRRRSRAPRFPSQGIPIDAMRGVFPGNCTVVAPAQCRCDLAHRAAHLRRHRPSALPPG